jgi:hypothetical protein
MTDKEPMQIGGPFARKGVSRPNENGMRGYIRSQNRDGAVSGVAG